MTKVNKVSAKKNLKNNINSTISYYKKTKKKQKIDKCNICGHIAINLGSCTTKILF